MVFSAVSASRIFEEEMLKYDENSKEYRELACKVRDIKDVEKQIITAVKHIGDLWKRHTCNKGSLLLMTVGDSGYCDLCAVNKNNDFVFKYTELSEED